MLLNDDSKVKKFSPYYASDLGLAIEEDKKRNPHLYSGSTPKYGLDFVYLAKLIGKLFKKKGKLRKKPVELITYKTMDSLFKSDKLFDLKLLNEELMIPEHYTHLFLDYCEARKVDKNLISKENKVIFLDSLVKFSKEFLEIAKEFKKPQDSIFIKK